MVTDAVADVLPIAIARGIDIGAEEMVTAHVRAVETDIGIAVKNLVSNAVRYTPDGGTIDLRMRRDGDMVWIDVIDTGPGIDEELLPRVFDRFFRANPDIEGSGLGLSIVKAIAARYGGDVTLQKPRRRPLGHRRVDRLSRRGSRRENAALRPHETHRDLRAILRRLQCIRCDGAK